MNCISCGEKLVEREYPEEGDSATDYILKKTYIVKGKCKCKYLQEETNMKILDIGCGDHKVRDAIGLDFVKQEGVDIVHNLNKIPYPFEDNHFDIIYANDILEHLEISLDDILVELCRILKQDGRIKVKVPHALSVGAFTDPTHKKFFTYFTFDYFGENEQSYYTKARVEIVKRRFIYTTGRKSSVILKPLEFLINLSPKIYSHFFAFIFPVSTIYFELKQMEKANNKGA